MIMVIIRDILVLLLLVTSTPADENTAKQKLLGLIKKLGTIVDRMKFDNGAEIISTTTAASANVNTEAPATPSEVKTTRDPSKTYCDNYVCPVGKTTAQGIAYIANLIKTKSSMISKLHQKCGMETYISLMEKAYDAGLDACASARKVALSLNTECNWKSAPEIILNNNKVVPKTGLKLWTSGRYAPECKKYVWCPDNEVIADDKWKQGYPKADAGNCVAVQSGSKNPEDNGLFNKKCSDSLNMLCTGPLPVDAKTT